MNQDDDERRTVINEVMGAANQMGSDAVLEAAVDWLDRHPEPTAIQVDAIGSLLMNVWHNDFAPSWMATDLWLKALRKVGFVSDRDRQPPRRSLVVYRGATERDRLGLAWTTSRAVAHGHVLATESTGDRPPHLIDPIRRLWRAVVPPQGVLARIEQRDEREVIVDPALLRSVREVEPDPR